MKKQVLAAVFGTFAFVAAHAAPAADDPGAVGRVVTETVQALMQENQIPGMAVAITDHGQRTVFNFGVASRESGQPVTDRTLFEIGSLSKTFTATLASYAAESGRLSLADPVARYVPALAASPIGATRVGELGTYTAGGLPLQFPDGVADDQQAIAYFRIWRPAVPAGTQRLYSNPSMGLFGYVAAASLGGSFDDLMQRKLFPMLGLTNTYIKVPAARRKDYAFGYSRDGRPIHVNPGPFDSEAYGVKTTAADMLRFVEANLGTAPVDATLERAIAATHAGYYRVGAMTQGLGWEMYALPANLEQMLAGNSSEMALQPHPVQAFAHPLAPRADVLVNKTGSTNGFGAYAAFIPGQRLGIVLLANRNYPIAARVKAAYRILTTLQQQAYPSTGSR